MAFFKNEQEEYETKERIMRVYTNLQVQNNKEKNHKKITSSLERNRSTYTGIAGGLFGRQLGYVLSKNDYREISYALDARKKFDRLFIIVTVILIIILLALIIL